MSSERGLILFWPRGNRITRWKCYASLCKETKKELQLIQTRKAMKITSAWDAMKPGLLCSSLFEFLLSPAMTNSPGPYSGQAISAHLKPCTSNTDLRCVFTIVNASHIQGCQRSQSSSHTETTSMHWNHWLHHGIISCVKHHRRIWKPLTHSH